MVHSSFKKKPDFVKDPEPYRLRLIPWFILPPRKSQILSKINEAKKQSFNLSNQERE